MRIRRLKSSKELTSSASPTRDNLVYKLRYKEVKTPHEKEFMSAVSLGYKKTVQRYLDGNNITFTLQDYRGDTPIHLAAKKSDRDLLHMLCLKYPASSRNRSKNNITPLHTAAKRGNILALKYFIEEAKVDIHSTDIYGANAAFYAVEGGQLECLRYLISLGINVRFTIKPDGNTILHENAKQGNSAIMRFLCEKCKIKPQYCNQKGQHAMHIATMNGFVEIVEYLHRKYDIDPFDPDIEGASSVTISVQLEKAFKVFEYFIKVIPLDYLLNGDPAVSRSLQNAPLTALKAAILYNNKTAYSLLIQKMHHREKLNMLWVFTRYEPYQKLVQDRRLLKIINKYL